MNRALMPSSPVRARRDTPFGGRFVAPLADRPHRPLLPAPHRPGRAAGRGGEGNGRPDTRRKNPALGHLGNHGRVLAPRPYRLPCDRHTEPLLHDGTPPRTAFPGAN